MTEQIDYDPNTVLEALNNKADRDLNNVTDGTYQVLTTKNITNCITKIPQDIKLELSTDGTLTLKAESKVYDGAGNAINITSDISTKYTTTSNQKELIFLNPNKSLNPWYISDCYSGNSKPSATNYCWYDTNTKIVKSTTSAGSTYTENLSLPLAAVTSDSTGITSIDQVFNGFGYIGSTLFALPGVEGLIPNGRNVDGSLNNTKFTTSSVLTVTSPDKRSAYITLNETDVAIPTLSEFVYDQFSNKNLFVGSPSEYCIVGTCDSDSTGHITSFTPKTTLQILDRNDKEEIISWGMPDWTAGVTKTLNTTYTAEVAGMLLIQITRSDTGRTLTIDGKKLSLINNAGACSLLPTYFVDKGSVYSLTGASGTYEFYPLKGVN